VNRTAEGDTTYPKCAKAYGKNYAIAFAEVWGEIRLLGWFLY
jgi:hypothetical protein